MFSAPEEDPNGCPVDEWVGPHCTADYRGRCGRQVNEHVHKAGEPPMSLHSGDTILMDTIELTVLIPRRQGDCLSLRCPPSHHAPQNTGHARPEHTS